MRIFVPLFVGLVLMSSAAAQDPAGIEFLPIPDTVPLILFAPHPLAGTMLGPLTQPQPDSPQSTVPAARPETSATAPTTGGAGIAAPPPADAEAAAATATVDPTIAPPANPPPAPGSDPAATPAAPAIPAAPAADKPDTTITVIVENVENDDGTVNVAVCDKELSREGCPYDTAIKATAGFVEARFDSIPPGTYAVVGYHDENGNDEFDKFLGVPREPYALSNSAAENLVPTFADAALKINKGENVVIIRLRRFGG